MMACVKVALSWFHIKSSGIKGMEGCTAVCLLASLCQVNSMLQPSKRSSIISLSLKIRQNRV